MLEAMIANYTIDRNHQDNMQTLQRISKLRAHVNRLDSIHVTDFRYVLKDIQNLQCVDSEQKGRYVGWLKEIVKKKMENYKGLQGTDHPRWDEFCQM